MTAITDILNCKPPKVYKSKLAEVLCANPELILGLELEIEGCPHDELAYAGALEKIWQVKTDGSLRGRNNGQDVVGNAYEFISKPAPLKVLIPELKTFFDTTKFKEENFTDRCSVHVHSNITDLTVHQIGTLFLTYSVVEDMLFRFINHYRVENPRGAYRDTNIYCVPWNQCRLNYDIMNRMFQDGEYAFRNWQKYTALNILPSRTLGTVEWRHMHGTADMVKLELWLNLIGRIFKYATETEFEAAVETIKKLNDNSAYQQYFVSVFGNYLPYTPELAKDLESGVVYAKYSMFNLKDYKVKVKEKKDPLKMYAEEMAGIRLEDFLPQQPAAAQAVEAQANWAPPPPEFQGNMLRRGPVAAAGAGNVRRVARRDMEVVIRQQEEAALRDMALSADMQYPLTRGLINPPNRLGRWGVRDARGTLRYSDGITPPAGYTFEVGDAIPRFVKGLGSNFWTYCDANWRPDNQVQANEEEEF